MKQDLVSIIIPTKNEEAVIANVLESVKGQTHKQLEIIVVDNNSSDKTAQIAKEYTPLVFEEGPERSRQRNFGAKKAKGKYLLFLDADMELTPNVVKDCVRVIVQDSTAGVIIPEASFGEGFWAKVKAFERSFYVGDETIEAARFYKVDVFKKIGGFDENLTGPEDWDLSSRVRKQYLISRSKEYIRHNEGKLSLATILNKKYYYAKTARQYLKKNKIATVSPRTVFFFRKAFYAKPTKLISHPVLSIAMFLMLFLEVAAGGFGYISSQQ